MGDDQQITSRRSGRDLKEAVTWFRKAVEQRHAHVQSSLCRSYGHGRGVKHDSIRTYAWMALAADIGGHPRGSSAPQSLEASMTPIEITDVQHLAQDLRQCIERAKAP